jgi:hypothetical protein
MSTGKPKKLRSFTAKSETWEVYKTHLDLVARLNRWGDSSVLEHFCTELAGEALEFYCSLSPGDRDDYGTVMTAMAQRFGTMVNAEAVRTKLETRKQKPNETLEQLATDIRMLAYKVYATDTFERREAETVRCFMKAVRDEHIVQALIQAHPVLSMSEALAIAVKARELTGAFLPKRSSVRTVQEESTVGTQSSSSGSNSVAEFLKQGDPELYAVYVAQEAGKALDRKGVGKGKGGGGNAQNRLCWYCQSADHWAKDCYLHPKNWPSEFKDMLRSGQLYQQPKSAPAGGNARTSQAQSGSGSQTTSNQKTGGQGTNGTGNGQKKGSRRKKNGGNASGGNNAGGSGPRQQPLTGETNAGASAIAASSAAVTPPAPTQGTGNA